MNNADMYRDGFKGIGLVLTGLFLALFFGWRQGWAEARAIWCPPEPADIVQAKADRVLAATQELEQEPHASVARRFLAGDMDADISLLGKRACVKIIALRAECVDVSHWTDRKLLDEIRSHGPSSVVPEHVHKAAQRAYEFAAEDGVVMSM